MKLPFHDFRPVAAGVRLRPFSENATQATEFGRLAIHPFYRIVSICLTVALALTSSPVLFGMSARQAMLPAGGGAGGVGSAANLQNAGAASAALTAAAAQAVQQKTDSAVTAMKAFQAQAHTIMAPFGVKNGLAAGWLETYNPSGKVNAQNVPSTWNGVSSLVQKGNAVDVTQSKQSAYLYWKNFNVGPETTLNFDQSAGGNNEGKWIAFNRVMGNVETQIFGSIAAQGQIYILNQNGILFHNGAQVNTHALVASTLPINDNLAGNPLDGITGRGIANNPDYQFLFSALPVAAGTVGPTAAFTPPAAPSGGIGNVVVEAGATISSPANASQTGGLVALIGPNVYNSGSISTPNGQTILAAGLQVGLNPHPSSDPSLRGMDVFIGKVSDPSVPTLSSLTGISENDGYLSIMEGDATIAGKTVNQNGVIDSSTSVSLNGRIDLLANYNAKVNDTYKSQGGAPILYQSTGQVTLGANSLMRILPEWSSDATVTGTALALNSIVSILGSGVDFNSGAVIDAPGAAATANAGQEIVLGSGATVAALSSGVNIQAGNWLARGTSASIFEYNSGAISLASDAEINVAGSTDVAAASAQNFLTLQLRGAELANSSLERTSSVRGVNLTLDTRITGTYNGQYWIGTPLGDATGYAALIERTVGELTTAGGSVSLLAGGSVVMQDGSSINTSGGWIQYSGGDFSTTKLLYQGRVIDISQATPDRVYSGIYTGTDTESFPKWGVTKTFTSILSPTTPQYQAPYISGAAGGSILIQAPTTILNGSLVGNTVAGPRQLRYTSALSTLPASSELTLDFFAQSLVNNSIAPVSSTELTVTFATSGFSSRSSIILSPDLVSSDGFGNLTILNHDGSILLPNDTTLNAGPNGSISLEAANVTILGNIFAPGGAVSLTADLVPYSLINGIAMAANNADEPILDVLLNKNTGTLVAQYGLVHGGKATVINADGTYSTVPTDQLAHYNAGIVTLGSDAAISTAGLVVNDMPTSSDRYQPAAINGGSIAISAYQAILNRGGVLNVSGGALLTPTGSISYGAAGSISISAGQASYSSSLADIHHGSLLLGSTLEGYSGIGVTAGSLSILAPAIQIGGNSSESGILNLSPDFFSQGGFGTFNLTGIGREIAGSSTTFTPGIAIAPGTLIHPDVLSSIIAASDGGEVLTSFDPADPFGTSPNISLTARGLSDTIAGNSDFLVRGDLIMGKGSSITLDPQIKQSGSSALTSAGSLAISAQTVTILGSITVPGGSISISGAGTFPSNNQNPIAPLITVDLASTARLSTAGEALFVVDPLGMRQNFGGVLSGGSISVSGNILAESGAVLDASGSSGSYDLFSYQLGGQSDTTSKGTMISSTTPYQVDSQGGSIALNGSQELYTEATLRAFSGGPMAPGGNLTISSGRSYDLSSSGQPEPTDLNLAVSQRGLSIPSSFLQSGVAAIGEAVAASGGIPEGGGHIAVDSFAGGGFDSVTLGGNVIFNGPVSLVVPGSIRVATKGVLSADSTVDLTASYVALGTPFIAPLAAGSLALKTAFGSSTDPAYIPPKFGTGSLNVTAQVIDIGNISLQGIGTAGLSATLDGGGGVIRGDGTFDIAGNLLMRASEIYPVSGVSFMVDAYNHNTKTGIAVLSGGEAGSITVERSGSIYFPLSAGGALSLYASSITQGGDLIAPFGTINLGNDGAASLPFDPVSGLFSPTAKNLELTAGSLTSISGVELLTGVALSVPFGTSTDGTSWIDPSGTTITTSGLASRSINLSSENLKMDQGSQIDLRGGGNETANQWISGLGGTINLLGATMAWGAGVSYAAGTLVSYKGSIWSARQANSTVPSVGLDWTQIPQYYAIIPGYDANFAPTGYADGSLAVGSRVTIAGGGGLPAGTYTLLPASYATQSGAYLISAASISSPLAGSFTQPDGSVIISGTTFNGLDSAVTAPRTTTLFTLLSPSAIANRVDYNVLSAGTFFSSLGASSQPDNAGKLLFQAITSMVLDGNVSGGGGTGGTGASIDISEPGAIDITQNGSGGKNGALVLGADQLSSWSFGSLLLGGIRGTPVNGLTPVTVTATSITLEGGATLSGNDIILAASDGINIDRGSTITASGSSLAPDEQISVSGDGVLIRVSSDQQAGTTRSGSDTTAIAGITLASGATLSGASLTLDSSENLSIDPNALLDSGTLNLDAGKIAINFNGSIESGALNLSGKVLDNLDAVNKLNLTSYSSIDFNGSGVLGSSGLAFLGIHAGEIQGDNSSFDAITAGTILLDDANGSPDPSGGSPSATGGSLSITGSILNLGSGALSIAGFQSTVASLSGGIEGITTKVSSSGVNVAGTLTDGGNLTFDTPIVTGGASSVTTIQSAGSLITAASGSSVLSPGLGASLRLRGRSVDVAAPTELPSGSVSIESTGGELTVASSINVAGVSKSYFNVTKYTDGGAITLSSDTGNIDLAGGSVLNLNAPSLAGSAGTLAVNAPQGTVIFNGSLEATAPQGQAGKLTADFNSYDGGNLATLESTLTASGFTQSQTIRLRSGDVTVSNVKAHAYTLTADAGSITVAGTINAAGQTGGSVALEASGSVILNAGSLLTVQAQAYNAAGKGGSILLSAGAEIDGKIDSSATLDLQSGSTIDLGVTEAATSTQDFGGVLHLRTPEAALQNITLASAIGGASAIEVEGYQLYQVSGSGGIITTSLRNAIASDIANFYGTAGANSSGASSILASLDANLSTENQRILNLAPGVEIINETGGLTLGSDWDLSTLRAGANSTPGFLTLRASGSITFNASLSDGFQSSAYNADLLSQNSALSANFQSWAYQITAGADLSAAIANAVVAGSDANVALGIVYNNGGQNVAPNAGLNASTAAALAGYYQVIRTGTGDISIASSGDLQLWNQFASIYTAGVQVSDPTMGGTFDVPQPSFNNQTGSSVLGVAQQTPPYAPQYSYAGGNINVDVGGNITQLTKDINKNIIGDSVSELPSNWLYRRGALAADGTFLHTTLPNSEILSTTWWVDFSNFFDDFGALGGGNITLNADQNISNINASIPTNYRMPGHAAGSSVSIAPDPANGVELGGGNLAVNAGNNIDAGVYYVEKGNGSLLAGGSIITNPTRDPNHPASLRPTADISASYLPTTLFLGKGNFDVQAAGDVLLGPVANVFLTPQGVNNSYWYKDYFSTYAASDQVNVESLGGNISFREEAVSSSTGTPESLLELWMQGFTVKSNANIAYSQPWLRLDEQTIEASLASLFALEPPTLNATALVGDITFQGNYTTLPSPTGNITLIAGGGINGLTDSGLNAGIHYWISSRINLSDADPSSIPGITDPDSQQTSTSVLQNASRVTAINYNIHSLDFTGSIAALFDESGFYTGGTYGVLQTKEQLHGTSLLHANDSVPLQFYAQSGDISGLTLFSAKQSEISAGGNIADVGIYIQNNSVSDVSIVTAGGSIIAYDPSTPFQQLAQAAYTTTDTTPSFSYTQTGDIQISGPGTLEVLAGGNLDLGNAPNYTDDNTEVAGAGVGITSIGNSRNPNLPFAGADIIAEAGVKLPTGLSSTGGLAMASFVNTVLLGAEGATYLSELSDAMIYSGDPLSGTITAASFASGSTQLSSEEKAKLELQLFYIVLRDTGRNHNKLGSPGYGSYAIGNKAIQNFFASTPGSGNIITWGQRIETVNGGNIDLLAPGGALTLANFTTSDSLTPPGIITEGGGGINIYTKGDVSIGLGRIFTLRGGDIMIWSNDGNIAAGSSSKTVQSAPPTQVLIDPQSGDVETDLAGLATGGGIGVLETVADVPPGNVDLIAPSGVIDAGDAGIRSSGNLNLAATKILNANNIAASGTTSGAPPTPPPPAAPNISGATSASAAAAANNSAAQNAATNNSSSTMTEEAPSIISVEVLGYGGGDDDSSSPSGPTTSTGSKAPPQASL